MDHVGFDGGSGVLVLGLGNPILGDDGIGWRVVEEAQRRYALRTRHDAPDGSVEFDCATSGGLALMERLVGYERVLIVDAIEASVPLRPGRVWKLTVDDLPTRHANSAHDATFKAALDLGRRLGAPLPCQIVIVAIEAEITWQFGEALSPEVAGAVDEAAGLVLAELNL